MPVKTLIDDFAQQLYLPRLAGTGVLIEALRSGVATLTWELDTFAYADSFDEHRGRYPGLLTRVQVALSADDAGVIVKPEVAKEQLRQDAAVAEPLPLGGPAESPTLAPAPKLELRRRYHGTVRLDPTRVGRDASQIAQEVIAHLAGLVGADVKVTIEIEANLPEGASEHVVRTVTENGRTLKFEHGSGFEAD